MGPTRTLRLIVIVIAAVVYAAPAYAQASRTALDVVAAADGDVGSQVSRKPTGWFDLFGAVTLADCLDLRARPVVSRRSFDGKWQTQMYELSLRYERRGRVGWRFEGGQFTSPIGLAVLENRPSANPVVSQHSTLYLPIPRYEPGTPSTYLIAAAYPVGGKVTASGAHWDARAAVIDSSPIRGRALFGANRPPRMANYVIGAGVTPYIGVRVGVAYARGPYATVDEVRDKSRGDRLASLTQVEGEWSFRHTRVAGEFLWTKRELARTDATVNGGWIELTQTVSPRVFLASRFDHQYTEWLRPDGTEQDEIYSRLETAVGVRLTRAVTARASYMTRKGYVVSFWDDQFLASVVYAHKFR